MNKHFLSGFITLALLSGCITTIPQNSVNSEDLVTTQESEETLIDVVSINLIFPQDAQKPVIDNTKTLSINPLGELTEKVGEFSVDNNDYMYKIKTKFTKCTDLLIQNKSFQCLDNQILGFGEIDVNPVDKEHIKDTLQFTEIVDIDSEGLLVLDFNITSQQDPSKSDNFEIVFEPKKMSQLDLENQSVETAPEEQPMNDEFKNYTLEIK